MNDGMEEGISQSGKQGIRGNGKSGDGKKWQVVEINH